MSLSVSTNQASWFSLSKSSEPESGAVWGTQSEFTNCVINKVNAGKSAEKDHLNNIYIKKIIWSTYLMESMWLKSNQKKRQII